MSDLLLFRFAVRDQLRSKKVVAALVLVLLPGLFAVLQRFADPQEFHPEVVYNVLSASVVFGFVLVMMSVVFGTGVVSQEIEQKTIVYLLTRPVPRWRILLVKFAAATAAITVTAWSASLVLALATYGPREALRSSILRDLQILLAGALAYGALFVLLAALLNRPLMYGLFFAFGWESWVPYLPGNFKKLSVMTYLRVLAPHPRPEGESIELGELLNLMNPQAISQPYAWKVLLAVIVVALVGALVVFSVNEYVPREDAE